MGKYTTKKVKCITSDPYGLYYEGEVFGAYTHQLEGLVNLAIDQTWLSGSITIEQFKRDFEEVKVKKYECCTCGYEWEAGKNGSHSCSANLLKKIRELKKENEKLKEQWVNLENAFKITNNAKPYVCVSCEKLKKEIESLKADNKDTKEGFVYFMGIDWARNSDFGKLQKENEDLKEEVKTLNNVIYAYTNGIATMEQEASWAAKKE